MATDTLEIHRSVCAVCVRCLHAVYLQRQLLSHGITRVSINPYPVVKRSLFLPTRVQLILNRRHVAHLAQFRYVVSDTPIFLRVLNECLYHQAIENTRSEPLYADHRDIAIYDITSQQGRDAYSIANYGYSPWNDQDAGDAMLAYQDYLYFSGPDCTSTSLQTLP